MRRLFEGGYYSKYRRRGYYLFQLYRNATTIRGRLLFEVQTSRLLFISALPQCDDYSRVATIRSTDVAATIYFSSTAMRRLFEGGYYSKYRRRGYYLFQLYRNATTIRGWLLFEVQTSRLLFISALPQCDDYSRVATIRSTDVAATIYFSFTAMRRLFEGGYYSKYRRRGYYYMIISRRRAPSVPQTPLLLGDCSLEQVDSFKYLGVLLSHNLSWDGQVQSVCSKARKILGLLYRRFYNNAPGDSLLQLYLSLVRPHLDYASAVWSPHLMKHKIALENVQKFACRMATKIWDSSYQDLLELVNLPTLEHRRLETRLCLLYRITHKL